MMRFFINLVWEGFLELLMNQNETKKGFFFPPSLPLFIWLHPTDADLLG